MPVKVLIVDDSVFFRNRISQILRADSRVKVVGTAKNGAEAVTLAEQLQPDVVTMDVEMPQMNGIEALKLIMQRSPCQVLMLSSLTRRSATTTLEALECGAADYMEKDARTWVADADKVGTMMVDKVIMLGRKQQQLSRRNTIERSMLQRQSDTVSSLVANRAEIRSSEQQRRLRNNSVAPEAASRRDNPDSVRIPANRILAIGASTGGPAALQAILPQLPASLPMPVLLIQHMPKTFTSVFAKRLNEQCQITVKEAEDGDRLLPGHAYLAPGGLQMVIDPAAENRIKVIAGDDRITYRPSVDLTLASLAKVYGNKVLAVILTGMGSDGCDGARLLKNAGSSVWAQDKSSCTIFGMPKAVITANLADNIFSLDDIGKLFQRGR
ncbi:protein-glutamate methylesterase/protein-glutamine glutaminase [Amphritea sp. HPY]|uniref:protein-glutamate methylesterase/protein-glutamine glutaminase n=1 Tax=Amphritea sp. HPY TaxID=3421652 RepID=UPI003D7E13FE